MERNLESIIQKIEERNIKVEADKAWETSRVRKLLLATFTYLAIAIYLWVIGVTKPWINAIVPTSGFMISTLTTPFFKKVWLNSHTKNKNYKVKNNGKHFQVFAGLTLAGIVLFPIPGVITTNAATGALPGIDVSIGGKSLNFDSLLSIFSGPISYFVETGKQIAGGFAGSVPHMNIGNLSANNTFSGLNDWFLRTTGGISITQVLKFFGNTIASVFSFFADLIHRGVAAL